MKKNSFFIGLDISKADFAASIYKTPDKPIVTKEAIPNNPEGFTILLLWLKDHRIDKTNSHICMEATGVYSQAAIAYYLLFAGFPVSVEPPLKVKRAFDPVGHKTYPDEVIEAACRRALSFGVTRYSVIKNICHNGSYHLAVEFEKEAVYATG